MENSEKTDNMKKLKELFDYDFVKTSDNMWLTTLLILMLSNNSSQQSGTTINIYINGKKVGVD